MRTLFYFESHAWSGSARAFAVAARGLAARGEPVTVVCRVDSTAEQSFAREGLDVVALPPGGSVTGDAWRLRRVLRERFVEVVFLHTEREQLVASSAMRLAERGAVIRRVPAGVMARAGRSSLFAGKMASARLLFATEADRARSPGGNRAFVAPLGVDVSRVDGIRAAARTSLGVDFETQLMVCVTAGSARIRAGTALRTLALLAERHPDLRLALVGPGSDEEDVHMHAAALGVSSLVYFLGERDDLPNVLAAADVGWVAADGDDGGFACLDFMAARVPIISERSPLIAHYVPDGIAGVLLPPADPSDTAAAVATFLAHDEQRDAMGRAGRTRAQRDFSEQAMIEGFASAASAAGDRASWAAR
ncbi:MAG: glycosyl transferase group 1 [Gemmatimonadetes bacterium]|nr:glycosyl transferase group 1 [Gemmatimonadota bacterium]